MNGKQERGIICAQEATAKRGFDGIGTYSWNLPTILHKKYRLSMWPTKMYYQPSSPLIKLPQDVDCGPFIHSYFPSAPPVSQSPTITNSSAFYSCTYFSQLPFLYYLNSFVPSFFQFFQQNSINKL
jgi:hypothetical protein